MKLSDKIQVEINQVRERALELAGIEKPTDENRSEITDLRAKMKTLGERHATALEAEEIEVREIVADPDLEDAEGKELGKLLLGSKLSRYVETSALEERSINDGMEAELNAALAVEDGHFPMQLLVDWSGEEERQQQDLLPHGLRQTEEHRVDAGTSLAISTMATSAMWLVRMLAMSNAQHLGVTTRSVGPGQHNYPYVGGTNTAGTPAKAAAQDAVAATVTTKTHSPRAVHTRYLITEEDRLRLGNAYEGALRNDLRNQIVSKLDNFVIADSTDGMIVIVPAATGDAALSADSTFAQMQGGVLSAVDGVYAGSLMDLNWSIRPAVYAAAGVLAPASTAAFLTDYLPSMGCMVKANAHIPADGTDAKESYTLVCKKRGIAGAAIMSVWNTGTMVLDSTGANLQSRQVALNVVGYFDFDVIRTDSFYKFRVQV